MLAAMDGAESRHAAPRTRLGALRDAAWLNPARLRAYGWMLLLGQAVVAASVLFGDGLLDRAGNPVGTDFSSFWTASRLALSGTPLLAWDPAAHHAAQRALFGAEVPYFAFFYPPPFLLACLPLALLPYGWSLAGWILATLAAWVAALRALLPGRWALLAMLAFPAGWVNATHGQNGFLTAALFAAAALALDRRAWLAGLCIGALVIKPHLAVAIPLALVVTGRWGAFVAAALAGLGMLGLSWLAFGEAGWQAFLGTSALARETLESGLVEPGKMVSVFAAARLLGAGVPLAWAAQATAALAAAAVLALALRRAAGGVAALSVAAAATPLMSPFLLDYDLLLLGLPMAWVTAQALRDGFLPWEKVVLAAAFVLPLVARPVALSLGVPLAPAVAAVLFLVVARRAAVQRSRWPGA